MTSPISTVLEELEGRGCSPRPSGAGQWKAKCPAHDDHSPSLSITEGDDGRALVNCHAKCEAPAIADSLGLTMADLSPPKASALPKQLSKPKQNPTGPPKLTVYPTPNDAIKAAEKSAKGELETQYPYPDKHGSEVMRVLRLQSQTGKTFRPIRPVEGGWAFGTPSTPLPLYNLPCLIDAPCVYVTEGEKAAEAAKSIGLTATTSAHGANSAKRTDWTPLAGKNVVIFPDNDKQGRAYAEEVAEILLIMDQPARSVRIVHLPDLPEKGDIVEWLEEHDAIEEDELRSIISNLVEHTPTESRSYRASGIKTTCMADVEPELVRWLWNGRIPLGKMTMIGGDPGLGKSFLTMDLAARVSNGSAWPDAPDELTEIGEVILMTAEDDPADTLRPRLDAAGANVSRIHVLDGVVEAGSEIKTFNFSAHMPRLRRLLESKPDIRLIIVDPISAYMGGVDSHKNADVRSVLTPLAELASEFNVAVVLVNHLSKGSGTNSKYRMTGSIGFVAAVRVAWLIARDENDPERRLMLCTKNNLAPDTTGMAYRLAVGDESSTPYVEWEPDPITMSADEVLAESSGVDGDKKRVVDDAAEWLTMELGNREMRATDIFDSAKDHGYSKSTLQRAKSIAGVEVKKRGGFGQSMWYWYLKDRRCSTDTEDTQPKEVGTFDKAEHLRVGEVLASEGGEG